MTIYKYAGFWRRLVAYAIDIAFISFIFFILATIASLAFFSGAISVNNSVWLANLTDAMLEFSEAIIFIFIFYTSINISYFTYFHGATGRTPGKMLLGLQVVNADGTTISFGTAFLRAVGYLVSSAMGLNLGFIWAAFDKRKQGWHDKIAGTVVIIREPQNEDAGISIPDNSPVLPTLQNHTEQGEVFKESITPSGKPPENNDN
jgi:uncharacterized RDD family membrane protein YckC